MRPLHSVQQELRCPEPDEDGKISAVLGKRPPTTLSVAAHGESVLLEDNYLFTSSAMRQCALRTLRRASAASLLGLGGASASPPALPPCAGMRSSLWAAASTRGARASATASLCRCSLNPALSPPSPPLHLRFRCDCTARQLSRAVDNVSIAAAVGFDMLANDFSLELSRGPKPAPDGSPFFAWEARRDPPASLSPRRPARDTTMSSV